MPGQKVFIAGHNGLLGSALVRAFRTQFGENPLTRGRDELDLRDQAATRNFISREHPDVILVAAAKVGGIHANNTARWEFLYENLLIEGNLLGAALEAGVPKVVFFGSSCIYPKLASQPIKEEYLLTGPLEPTNEPYAIAKIAGLKLVEAANSQYGMKWLSLMPTNLYGPGDNFDLNSSHVLPAMLRKFHEARIAAESGGHTSVKLWGTGAALREFLHADDAAAAAFHLLGAGHSGLFNVGSGDELSIADLATKIAEVVGYSGPVEWDASRPDGTPRKLLDSSKLRATGWRRRVELDTGLRQVYAWYQTSQARRDSAAPAMRSV